MILTKKVNIKINNRHVKYYKEKGYDIKGGDQIDINIADLPEQSHVIVKVKCDVCDDEKEIMYYNYINNIENQFVILSI